MRMVGGELSFLENQMGKPSASSCCLCPSQPAPDLPGNSRTGHLPSLIPRHPAKIPGQCAPSSLSPAASRAQTKRTLSPDHQAWAGSVHPTQHTLHSHPPHRVSVPSPGPVPLDTLCQPWLCPSLRPTLMGHFGIFCSWTHTVEFCLQEATPGQHRKLGWGDVGRNNRAGMT